MNKETEKLVKAFGFLYPEEAELLEETARDLKKDAVVVNIGAGAGTSALAIIEQRNDLAKTTYTIDLRDDDNPFGGHMNERNAFRNAGMLELLPNQIKGDSKKIGKEWSGQKVDLLIIDGDHSTEGCLGDIKSWEPNLKSTALVLIHDYQAEKWPAVKNVVDKIIKEDARYTKIKVVGTYILIKYNARSKKKTAEK